MGDEQCLQHFRFLRKDLLSVVDVVTLGPNSYSIRRNVYSSTWLLATSVLLKRLSTPQRWVDLEIMFRKHTPQLSEVFRECSDDFVYRLGYLITGPIGAAYTSARASEWAEKVARKVGALKNCIGYIDGTVLEIAPPHDGGLQNVVKMGISANMRLSFKLLQLQMECSIMYMVLLKVDVTIGHYLFVRV